MITMRMTPHRCGRRRRQCLRNGRRSDEKSSKNCVKVIHIVEALEVSLVEESKKVNKCSSSINKAVWIIYIIIQAQDLNLTRLSIFLN